MQVIHLTHWMSKERPWLDSIWHVLHKCVGNFYRNDKSLSNTTFQIVLFWDHLLTRSLRCLWERLRSLNWLLVLRKLCMPSEYLILKVNIVWKCALPVDEIHYMYMYSLQIAQTNNCRTSILNLGHHCRKILKCEIFLCISYIFIFLLSKNVV